MPDVTRCLGALSERKCGTAATAGLACLPTADHAVPQQQQRTLFPEHSTWT
jgi:hypothetical protein